MIDQRSSEKKAEPIGKIGVVVNFTENTVSFAGYVVPIIKADAAGVAFDGHGGLGSMKALVSGKFDRITGIVTVSTSTTAGTWNEWDLTNCKPAAHCSKDVHSSEPQSTSASRFTAGAFGFLTFI